MKSIEKSQKTIYVAIGVVSILLILLILTIIIIQLIPKQKEIKDMDPVASYEKNEFKERSRSKLENTDINENVEIYQEKDLKKSVDVHTNNNIEKHNYQGYSIINNNGKEYYVIEDTYQGEYYIQEDITIDNVEEYNTAEVMNYSKYVEFCNNNDINQKYTDENINYIVFAYGSWEAAYAKAKLANIEYNDDTVTLYIWDSVRGVIDSSKGYVIVIPTEENVSIVKSKGLYDYQEYKKYSDPNYELELELPIAYKPIIYLYPEEEQKVSVKLGNKELITCSYPKYIDGWNVLAKPNGDLVDLDTNKNLYALYYESKNDINFKIEKDGFVVKGKDVAKFLEEKLSILGLTDREKEEFIVYWLPRLEANKYNYIRFATSEEIEENMPLEISPKPDTTIRVLMIFKGLEEPIEVKEQEIEKPERDGYVAVEWGGTEIK